MILPTRREIIAACVKKSFAIAGFDYDLIGPKIVPLSKIIKSYSLQIKELPDARQSLTYTTANNFLSAKIGQMLQSHEEEGKILSGYLYTQGIDGFILTERSEPTARRRFSAAHELGHYLLHLLPLVEERDEYDESLVFFEGFALTEKANKQDEDTAGQLVAVVETESGPRHALKMTNEAVEEREEEANLFAAEILMPANACRELAGKYVRKFGKNKAVLARVMATEFLVSQEAMKTRLRDLGLYQVA